MRGGRVVANVDITVVPVYRYVMHAYGKYAPGAKNYIP